ncbi:hypothetical protein [Nonomuraea dietziae]|uniref:hypothetical protein n=1 Tax=Nonomuraea dietziae TaxID=65515 RepID=UPI0031DB08FF
MLLLAADDSERDIYLYINSPGRIRDRGHGDLRQYGIRPSEQRGHGRRWGSGGPSMGSSCSARARRQALRA